MRGLVSAAGVCLAALAAMPSMARAEKVVITFEGKIFAVAAELVPPLSGIDEASGSVEYELETPDADPEAEHGTYFGAPSHYTLTVGPYTATADGVPTDVARVNLGINRDAFQIEMEEPVGEDVNGLTPTKMFFSLEDDEAAVFATDALPTSLALADFEHPIAALQFTDGEKTVSVSVEIQEMEVVVPEPGPPLLLATGALALGAAARRRRGA